MKSLSKFLIPLILVILFGKFIPILIVGALLVVLVLILQAAVKEGRVP